MTTNPYDPPPTLSERPTRWRFATIGIALLVLFATFVVAMAVFWTSIDSSVEVESDQEYEAMMEYQAAMEMEYEAATDAETAVEDPALSQ